MVGQGSPSIAHAPALSIAAVRRSRCARRKSRTSWCLKLIAVLALAICCRRAAAEPSLQLRIEWGHLDGPKSTDAARQWRGEISIDRGQVSLVRSLGIEADEPGSVSIDNGRLEIHPRSARTSDGLDVLVTAPLEAVLSVELRDLQNPNAGPVTTTVPLLDLISKPQKKDLDKSGNRVLIRRAPGDLLRVNVHRDQLVFSPSETLQLDVEPRLLNEPAGSTLQIRGRLLALGGSADLGTQEQSIKTTAEESSPATIPWQFKLPANEGIYEVVIEAFEPATLRSLGKPKLIAERRVQLVVIGERAPAAADANAPWATVMEIDPANPHWYDQRFKNWLSLTGVVQGILGNVTPQAWQGTVGTAVQMPPNPTGGEACWQAYPLTVVRPGAPHILEVEVPSDVPQTLGISIVESTPGNGALGADRSTALDTGLFIADELLPSTPKWVRHRVIFWPRTKTPILLLTNRSDESAAVYGKIRVLAGPSKLPRAFAAGELPERMVAGYLSRPSFSTNFGAPQSVDPVSSRGLDDWQTFYFGTIRLAEYLHYVGYGGQMITVMADGSTIYPSQLVEPTLNFDTGAAFESGQDPVRKDALELLFRIFDREGLRLVPAMKFDAPLPELEALLQRGGADAAGIQLVGPGGNLYSEKFPSHLGAAPYYNPLNPRVQEAILNVVRELLQRYQQHPALAGVAVELSANGYLQLPGELWGLDDDTIARFEHDTQTKVPGDGNARFAERAKFFAKPDRDAKPNPRREAWLQWRAGTISQFYRRLQNELTTVRRDAVFYISPTELFDAPEAARQLAPTLSMDTRIYNEVLLALGIRTNSLRDQRGMLLLRPERIAPPVPIAEQGTDFELNRSPDLDEQFSSATSTGRLLTHGPLRTRLPSFEAKSPFGKERTPIEFALQISPADARNRERFIHALSLGDLDVVFDGGSILPLGQEDSLLGFLAAYRRLPVGKFVSRNEDTQPVTVRTLSTNNSTYAYLLNDSPWPVNVQLQLDMPAGCRIEELSGRRRLPVLNTENWIIPLEPFDLMAIQFHDPEVRIKKVVAPLDQRLKTVLEKKLFDLQQRQNTLGNPPMLAVLSNPNFELPARAGQIPGWSLVNPVRGVISVEPEGPEVVRDRQAPAVATKPAGKQALRFVNQGLPPAVAVATRPDATAAFRSEPFPATHTGRMSILVWLRVDDPKNQPALRIAIEGLRDGQPVYYQPSEEVGQNSKIKIDQQWSQFLLPLHDLPTAGLDKLQVRFDLTAPGSVWIDNVQLSDLWFLDEERYQLIKTECAAQLPLEKGNYAECLHKLEGYWPRYLFEYVPLPQAVAANANGANGVGNLPGPPAGQPAQSQNPNSQRKPEQSAAKPWNAFDKLRDVLK